MIRYTPLAVSSVIATIILLCLSFYGFWRGRSPVMIRMGLLLLLGSFWAFFTTLQFLRTDLEGKIIFSLLHIPCVSLMLCLLLLSVLEARGGHAWTASWRVTLLLVEPLAAFVLAFTARDTGLFLYDFRLAPPSPGLLYSSGPLWWAHVTYSFAVVAACILLLARRLRGAVKRLRWQTILIIIAIGIPALTDGLYLTGISPAPGVNIAPISQILGSLCIAGALILLPLGAAVPVAASVILRTMEDLVLVVDAGGRLTGANQSACAVIGLESPPLGVPLEDLPEPWREALAPWWGAASARETVRVSLPGKTLSYHLAISPLRDDAAQRPLGNLLLLHDVTERTEAEEALRRSEEHLRQSQKMEAVGKLAGGVAHDYNNLLMVITGHCDLLGEEIERDSPLARQVAEISRAARRASAITAQLLAFSGKQILRPRRMEINSLIRGMEDGIRGVLGDGVRLTLKLLADGGFVLADPEQIEQAVMNLVVNARDAMPDGGELAIMTARSRVGFLRDHPEVKAGEYVTVAVSDTGVGMSDQIVSRIFEPFFTTKEVGGGPGLGLPTTYGIVKQSGGYIYCSSTPGRGTSFLLYLPRAGGAPEAVPV